MNFKEGTRRLALLVGGFGVIGGCFGSYLELKSALQQRAMHNTFERLAASDDVTKERKCRLLGYGGGCSQIELPPNATLVAPDGKYTIEDAPPPAHGRALLSDAKPIPSKQSAKDTGAQIDYDALAKKYGGVDDPYANLPDTSVPHWTPPASELDGKEIKTINWGEGKDYTVESVTTEDGNTLNATSLPSLWIYFWAVIFPIAGFVIPWSLIRSIGWVAAGFVVR